MCFLLGCLVFLLCWLNVGFNQSEDVILMKMCFRCFELCQKCVFVDES